MFLPFLAWILVGIIIGTLLNLLLPSKQQSSLLQALSFGILGSLAGGVIGLASFGLTTPLELKVLLSVFMGSLGFFFLGRLLKKSFEGRR